MRIKWNALHESIVGKLLSETKHYYKTKYKKTASQVRYSKKWEILDYIVDSAIKIVTINWNIVISYNL